MTKKEAVNKVMFFPDTSIITTGDKGGVGKTFLMQAILAYLASIGIFPTIIEFDEGPRLQVLYGRERCHSFTLSRESMGDVQSNPEALFAVWDDAMQIAREAKGMVVWDFGSNATKPFCDYVLEQSYDGFFGRGEKTVVFGVTTGHPAAASAVQLSLGYVRQALPAARQALVINDADPNFRVKRGAEAIAVLSDACDCPGYYLEQIGTKTALSLAIEKNLSLEEMATKDVNFWKSIGLSHDAGIRAKYRIGLYLNEVAEMLTDVLRKTEAEPFAG